MISIALAILVTITITTGFIQKWYLAKGVMRPAYWGMIILNISYFCINTLVALNDPSQISVMLMNIVAIWGIMMGTKGLIRLKKESGAVKVRDTSNIDN